MRKRVLMAILMMGLATTEYLTWGQQKQGRLELSISDGVGGPPTPARVELLNGKGKAYIAEDAIPVGPGYPDRVIPWKGDFNKAVFFMSKSIENPYTRTTQFYSTGTSRIALPPGTYKLGVYKGIEYKLEVREVRLRAGQTVELKVPISRWINMPGQGWYSADDHLHISRPVKEMNPVLSKWMQAEGINVANLLQFGTWKRFVASPQYDHGPGGVYREGDYLLVSGQEILALPGTVLIEARVRFDPPRDDLKRGMPPRECPQLPAEIGL